MFVCMRTIKDVYNIISYTRKGRINLPYKFLSYKYNERTKLTDLEKCLVSTLVRVYMVSDDSQIKNDIFDSLFGMVYSCNRFSKIWYDEASWKEDLKKAMTVNRYAKIRPEEKVVRIIESFMRKEKRIEREYKAAEERYC